MPFCSIHEGTSIGNECRALKRQAGIKNNFTLGPLHTPHANYNRAVVSSLKSMKVREIPWEETRERKMRELRVGGGTGAKL